MVKAATRLVSIILLACASALPVPAADDDIDSRLKDAESLYRQEGPEKALPEFERLATEFKQNREGLNEAVAVHFIGESHWRMGDFVQAREHLDRALTMKRDLGDRRQEMSTLNVLGLLEWDLGNYAEAKDTFGLAIEIARDLGDTKLEGAILNNLSLVYDELGDYRVAIEQYEQVLKIYSNVDFPRGEGDTLGNIGRVYIEIGDYRKALEYFNKARDINDRLGSKVAMSQDHGSIAVAYLGLGEIDTALTHFDKAIELSRQTGMQHDLAYWQGGKGNALVQKGLYDKGLEEYAKMLAVYDTAGAHVELTEALHDVGQLHLLLGDPMTAEQHFTRAIEIARGIGRAYDMTVNLIALGNLEYQRDRMAEAFDYFDRARVRATEFGDQVHVGVTLLRLSEVHAERQELGQALEKSERALTLARSSGARNLEGEAQYMLADLHRQAGDPEIALKEFDDAESTLQHIGDPDLLWQLHYGRAKAHEALGDKSAAVTSLIAAVNIIEGVRNRLHEQRFRTGYLQDKYEVYVELVRLQLELNLTDDAFSTAERLRARSYAAQLERGGRTPLTNEDQRKEFELRERVRQLQRALAEEENQARPERRQAAVQTFSHELLLAQQDYQSFLDDRGQRQQSPQSGKTVPTRSDIQARLADGEVLIEYVVGQDNIMMFAISATHVFATSKVAREADFRSRVELLRDLIRDPEDDHWLSPAAGLASTLIEPLLESGRLKDARHLYIVPHGILNYLPFSLLPFPDDDKESVLLDAFTLAYLPTAAALNETARPATTPQSLLAMAPTISRLKHAPEEARSIDALFQPNSRLLIGEHATESRFKTLAGDYQVLHLATHGYFNKLNPMFSGIRLEPDDTDDGLLEVHEVFDLDLDADLVTLSACDTALGSGYFAEVPAGDEFVGLTRAFLSVGSDTVMATLWEVDDRSSVNLMKKFYGRLGKPGAKKDKSAALADAQRDLRSRKEYQHPYYWAPFILVGNVADTTAQQTEISEATL